MRFKFIQLLWSFIAIFLINACTNENSKTLKNSEFYVRGNCEMCKERIEDVLGKVDGVNTAEWDVKTQVVKVTFDTTKTNLPALNKVIAKAGHETKTESTPEEVHNNLPACCKKMKM